MSQSCVNHVTSDNFARLPTPIFIGLFSQILALQTTVETIKSPGTYQVLATCEAEYGLLHY